ncbi:aldo/keto reductase [Streptomyces sp. JV176]|uniref:aldo/keto reductase n=1 Tax=Streptomyces sp. JV176 TaxID=858630 RepID=UPI002E76BB22|nr:aldo/keto reductase [Streptomyces sp. JV176]MEE1799504.1 aldo/keto reductase [Streptomyces sp. JV176]
MQYTKLGNAGIEVSRVGLGCMSFGGAKSGRHNWTLDDDAARPVLRAAVEGGINFFDTANTYSAGDSERMLGEMLPEFTRRDSTVIATKVFGRTHEGPNTAGLSRKAIMQEAENSLRRLKTDYIDLYQIHRFDRSVPIEETLEALNDLVRAGKVLYLGASTMRAWEFAQAVYLQKQHGWAQFVSMQNYYNLLFREEEREMIPFAAAHGVGITPWSPLARGRLTRPRGKTSARSQNDVFGSMLIADVDYVTQSDDAVIDAVEAVAAERESSMAEVALQWLLGRSGVTSPIVGARTVQSVEETIRNVEAEPLTPDQIARLEKPYVPHPIVDVLS